MWQAETRRPVLGVTAAIAVVFAVFSLWPGIDLAVSGWFFQPDGGFLLDRTPVSEAIRNSIWNLSIAFVVFAVAMLGLALIGKRRPLAQPARFWGYIVAVYALAPGILVNGILKSHWGRARPADVGPFGGTALFTPPWQISDQCAKNCSFVSGEVSAAVALAIGIWLLSRGRQAVWRRLGLAVALVLPAVTAAQRVATGRHFLSDVILAALFTAWIAAALWPLLMAQPR